MEWLLSLKTTSTLRSWHFWIIAALVAGLGYVYYGVLTTFRDIYVILFFYPLLYAAVVYRVRGVAASWLVFLVVLMPNALLFPGDPYSVARSLLFAAFGFLIGGLTATQLNYLERQVEAYEQILSLNSQLSSYIERLEGAQKQLIQSEKMNALGQLSASIAHEINNPLAGALVYARLLSKKMARESFDKEEALTNLSKIDAAVSHCSTLVKGLLDFARQSEPVLRPIAVSKVIDQVMSLVGHQAQMNKTYVVREDMAGLPAVMADPDQMTQVLINLVVNAIQAMPTEGKLVISTSGNDKEVRVSVQDNGSGIAPENLSKLFTPFFTTKEAGKGVGLGLAVSYGIVERHGGRIEVESKVGEGSTFTIVLPVSRAN